MFKFKFPPLRPYGTGCIDWKLFKIEEHGQKLAEQLPKGVRLAANRAAKFVLQKVRMEINNYSSLSFC